MTTTIFARIVSEADFAPFYACQCGHPFDDAERRTGEREVYAILDAESGEIVTVLPGCWPLGSHLGGENEHPAGIYLDRDQVARLGIEVER